MLFGDHFQTDRPAATHTKKLRAPAQPFRMAHPAVERIRDIPYHDEHERHCLDIYRPKGLSGPFPTLLQIHGGAWVISKKEHQGQPLMNELTARGWACVAINYRLSPKAKFPDHMVDVKRAIHWMRTTGQEYGIDPEFIAVTGGSAGGHLSALTALTPNKKEFQPGL